MRTIALPLGSWIVLAIAAGALTILWMESLLQMVRLSARGHGDRPTVTRTAPVSEYPESATASRNRTAPQSTSPAVDATSASSASTTAARAPENLAEEESDFEDEFDWEEAPQSDEDEFDWEEEGAADSRSSAQQRDSAEPEVDSPESLRDRAPSKPTDSAYSYSYRQSRESGAGRPESVYDADYRVIIPPYNPLEDAEDYDFVEDEDAEEFIEMEEPLNEDRGEADRSFGE